MAEGRRRECGQLPLPLSGVCVQLSCHPVRPDGGREGGGGGTKQSNTMIQTHFQTRSYVALCAGDIAVYCAYQNPLLPFKTIDIDRSH